MKRLTRTRFTLILLTVVAVSFSVTAWLCPVTMKVSTKTSPLTKWPIVQEQTSIDASFRPSSTASASTSGALDSAEKAGKRKRLLVVGGGIGGLSSAFDAHHDLRDVDITVVSDEAVFSFTPSNPWIAVKTRSPKDIQLNLRDLLPRHKIDFVQGRAIRLDPKKQQLHVAVVTDRDNKENSAQNNLVALDYDYLLIATGPRLATETVSGMEHGGVSVCTTPHALNAAHALDRLKARPGPVVVGATQGASCFGPAYEYAFLLQHALQEAGGQTLVDQCPMTFVTAEPYIGHLGLEGAGDSKSVLTKMLEKRNVTYMTNTRIHHVDSDNVRVQQLDKKGNVVKECELPSHLTMLIPPFQGHDVWKSVPGLTDDKGLILVNDYQQSPKFANIFAAGVSVHLPPLDAREETVISIGIPKTGYMIESMGTAAIQNIGQLIQESENNENKSGTAALDTIQLHSKPFLHGLCLTDFGGGEGAIFVTAPQIPPRKYDWTIDNGFVASLAKVAFEKYFLWKLQTGDANPFLEQLVLKAIGIERTRHE